MLKPPRDYRTLIAEALSDTSGNGYRMEAVARAIHALLFHEAARACEQAHEGGFPLALESQGERFLLTAGAGMGPRFEFDRNGIELTMIPSLVADAAIGDRAFIEPWKPGALPFEQAQARVSEQMSRAVQALARHVAVQRSPLRVA